MKKSLVSLAVAAVVATPMAAMADSHGGAKLYGSLRVDLVSMGDMKVADGGSRIGIKGSHDLGNGMNGVYRIEYGLNTAEQKDTFSGRLGYVGVTGGFGGVLLGSMWTPYYDAVLAASDPFNRGGLALSTYVGRANNALAYTLPAGMPISGGIGLVMGDMSDEEAGTVDENDVDAVNVGLAGSFGPVTVGLGMHDVEGADDAITGVSIGGSFGGFGLTLLVQDEGASSPMYLTAKYGGAMLQYGDADNDAGDNSIAAQYNHKLGDMSQLQFMFADKDGDADSTVGVRVRMDF